jgi:hypothetical protein
MKKQIIILFLFCCVSFSSCDKFLDTKPQDFVSPENYYNTEEDLNRALNGVYNRLIDTFGRLYQRGLWSYLVVSDEFFFTNVTTNNIRVLDFNAAQLDISRFWEVTYQGIDRANALLENVDKPVMNEAKRANIKGQALFLRAYYYFLLVDHYGSVPLKLTSTKSPTDANVPQSSVEDIYTQIVKDMQEAELLVNSINANGTNELISKTGVQAILARVYLTMAGAPLNDQAKYGDALIYADKVINSGLHSLNPSYQQIFINHSQDIIDSKECIWEIAMFGNFQGTTQIAGSVGIDNGIRSTDATIGLSAGTMQVTGRVYRMFGTGDLRRDWAIAPFFYTTNATTGVTTQTNWTATQIWERNIGKWRRSFETLIPKHRVYNSTNFPVIRYSDVLLMKAEAEYHVNSNSPTIAAYNAINQVRRRGYGVPLNAASLTADLPAGLSPILFLAQLRDERERELGFEGLRKHDLIRWGQYLTNMQTLITEVTTTAPTAQQLRAAAAARNVTARNLLFPIPTTELNSNPLIKQNPGWF